jgi:hypothetical protein
MRELVAAALAELGARSVAVAPIPATGRVTVAFVLDATSERRARERIAAAISGDDRFGRLGWSIAALYPAGDPG